MAFGQKLISIYIQSMLDYMYIQENNQEMISCNMIFGLLIAMIDCMSSDTG